MTFYTASLFLPYTIDFGLDNYAEDRVASPPANYAVDGSGYMADQGQEVPDEQNIQPLAQLPRTPGATIDNEKVFAGYTSRKGPEMGFGLSPNEPRDVTWGHSRMLKQPISQATEIPTPSMLRTSGPRKASGANLSLDGPQDSEDLGESDLPRNFISEDLWLVKNAEKGLGGVSNAMNAAERNGILCNHKWIGTLGMPTDSLTEDTKSDIANFMQKAQRCLTVFAGDTEFEGHYNHFCHAVLWPVLHYQMQESPRHSHYDRFAWDKYVKLNEKFADVIVEHLKDGDRIWIHDYHLMLLPGLLRKRRPELYIEIGFFLHTPFPSSEVFRCLSVRDQLLDGMLGADLIGFQTEEYRNHFLQSCSRLRRLDISAGEVIFNGRAVSVVNIPMGIDPSSLNLLCKSTEVEGWIRSISHGYRNKRLVAARDRLDVSGGIKQRLLAFELMLKSYPELRNDVVLIQVISSAGEVPELEAEVSKITMRINKKYSSTVHQPVVLLQEDIGTPQLIALLMLAEVFMATGLREGINLTSHEYILCQGEKHGIRMHGSLIISEFVGSASVFHDCNGPRSEASKLLVNPWNYKQCAAAIRFALSRSAAGRLIEWKRLRRRMADYTAINWYENLQMALDDIRTVQYVREDQLTPLSRDSLAILYCKTESRLFFFEDLVISGQDPTTESSPFYEGFFRIFAPFFKRMSNRLYIVSRKTSDQLDGSFPNLPSTVGVVLENEGLIRHPNAQTWHEYSITNAEWLPSIRKLMDFFQERTEGSRIEASPWSLVFHFDGALDREVAARQASELADQINGARGEFIFQVIRKETSVSVELPLSSQGRGAAARYIVDDIDDIEYPEYVLVVGDSEDNAALFRWANEMAETPPPPRLQFTGAGNQFYVFTLATGEHHKEAKFTLPDEWTFWELMRWLMLWDGQELDPDTFCFEGLSFSPH